MDHCVEVYNCSLKESWKAFIEYMKTEDLDDIDDMVFVYDKDDEVAWMVESHRLDDFAEALWDNCALWEKPKEEEFEDFVIIQLINEETKNNYPSLHNNAKRTGIPKVYRETHYFHVSYDPSFGSSI